jgi:hypothetical protein
MSVMIRTSYDASRNSPVASVESCSNTLFTDISFRLVDTETQLRHLVAIVEGEFRLEVELVGRHGKRCFERDARRTIERLLSTDENDRRPALDKYASQSSNAGRQLLKRTNERSRRPGMRTVQRFDRAELDRPGTPDLNACNVYVI